MSCMTRFYNTFMELFVRRLFHFERRANRKEYIIRMSTYVVIRTLAPLVIKHCEHHPYIIVQCFFWLFILFSITYILQCFTVSIRRLHDINYSGWWILLGSVPITIPYPFNLWIPHYSALFVLVLCCIKGTEGANKYGERPEF
jgi:uncharacterized membrane protein YhaH (DUF805 family)